MKMTITSGTGFMGRNVARWLAGKGHQLMLMACLGLFTWREVRRRRRQSPRAGRRHHRRVFFEMP